MMTPTPPASPLPWTMRCHGPIGGSVAGPTSQQCRKRGRWLRGYAEPLCGEHAQRAGYAGRSEERRVGKECRSRWSPYH